MGKSGKKRRVNGEIKATPVAEQQSEPVAMGGDASGSRKTIMKPTMEDFLHQQLTEDDLRDLLAEGVEDASEDPSQALPTHMELGVIDALKQFSTEQRRHTSKLRCQWGECTFRNRNDPEYIAHVEGHAETKERNQYGNLACEWEGCDYLTSKSEHFLSHLHFHGYHGQLKAHARSLHKLIDIPVCNRDTDKRNAVPELPARFECEWDGCESKFLRILSFFQHVTNHANEEYMAHHEKNSAWCRWKNCDYKLDLKSYRYRNHVVSHTNQKDIACDVCGVMLITPRKYLLHVCRRMDLSLRRHQCLQCGRYYATKKLLYIHCYEIHRPFTVLCPHCPSKFRRPGQLAVHIARRHRKDFPFVCDKCEYRANSKAALATHAEHHKEVLRCTEVGCNLAFHTKQALRTHLLQHYDIRPRMFECHLCQQRYRFGAQLSKHMFFTHKGKRDMSATPLRFKQDVDGIFRLRSYVESKTDRLS